VIGYLDSIASDIGHCKWEIDIVPQVGPVLDEVLAAQVNADSHFSPMIPGR
jgi:hypothetical protein